MDFLTVGIFTFGHFSRRQLPIWRHATARQSDKFSDRKNTWFSGVVKLYGRLNIGLSWVVLKQGGQLLPTSTTRQPTAAPAFWFLWVGIISPGPSSLFMKTIIKSIWIIWFFFIIRSFLSFVKSFSYSRNLSFFLQLCYHRSTQVLSWPGHRHRSPDSYDCSKGWLKRVSIKINTIRLKARKTFLHVSGSLV